MSGTFEFESDANDYIQGEEDEEVDYDDEDEKYDDYANQDEDIDKTGKQKEEKTEIEDIPIDMDNFDDLTRPSTSSSVLSKRKTSGYPIVSFIEHTKLYAVLCEYLSQSKIDIPPEIMDSPEIMSGDIFRAARYWISVRDKFPIPLSIDRHIVGSTHEIVDINKSIFMEDLDFHDDNNDEYRFHYNFNSKPYGS